MLAIRPLPLTLLPVYWLSQYTFLSPSYRSPKVILTLSLFCVLVVPVHNLR